MNWPLVLFHASGTFAVKPASMPVAILHDKWDRPVAQYPVCSPQKSLWVHQINCPIKLLSSTSERTLSHRIGIVCHSSISRGVSPRSNNAGFISANCLLDRSTLVSPSFSMLLAKRDDVVVFPHHLAPSTSTAPLPSNLRSSKASTTLFL